MNARRQARVVAAKVGTPVEGGLPPEFLIGRCIEVWAVDEASPMSAFSRYGCGLRAYASELGVSIAELTRNKGAGCPYSAEFMIERGQSEHLAKRLAAAGVTVEDIPALRRAATTRLRQLPDMGIGL